MCQLNPKELSYNYFIALLSTGNFKLAQQISYGHVSALATDVGTISKLFAMGCVTLVLGYNGKNSLRPQTRTIINHNILGLCYNYYFNRVAIKGGAGGHSPPPLLGGVNVTLCSLSNITQIINPQRACARGLHSQFVYLSVCLSTSDFEDDSVFTFETGINVN